jgi:hypothetical protein
MGEERDVSEETVTPDASKGAAKDASRPRSSRDRETTMAGTT